jgi:acyl-CoA reductase-like NAD-dependent aldehyde dehydrogenase
MDASELLEIDVSETGGGRLLRLAGEFDTFGGNKRSGIGSKAGGPDYLLQFAEPRVMTENTMRHGLVID